MDAPLVLDPAPTSSPLFLWIRREGGQPGVLDGATNGEMVEILVPAIFETEEFVHGIVEVAADASTPYAGGFGFQI